VVLVAWATAVQLDRMASEVAPEAALVQVASALGLDLTGLGGEPGTDTGLSVIAVPGGDVLVIPVSASAASGPRSSAWGVHVVGLLAEISGVFMSFWLAKAADMVPRRLKGQILGLSLVLGVVSYSSANAATVVGPVLTPQHVFASVKDGFVWAAAFPMFARAFGLVADDAASDTRRESGAGGLQQSGGT
jgi:hypothetical protein